MFFQHDCFGRHAWDPWKSRGMIPKEHKLKISLAQRNQKMTVFRSHPNSSQWPFLCLGSNLFYIQTILNLVQNILRHFFQLSSTSWFIWFIYNIITATLPRTLALSWGKGNPHHGPLSPPSSNTWHPRSPAAPRLPQGGMTREKRKRQDLVKGV